MGLGNPGRRYQATRHNIGAEVVDVFAACCGIELSDSRSLFIAGSGQIDSRPVAIAIPNVFMNVSGRAVVALLAATGHQPDALVVTHDDMDLPVGQLRLRRRGHDGGHQGIRSIQLALQTDRFFRLKLGIGHPPSPDEAADYVLSKPPPHEQPLVTQMMDRAVEALRCLVLDGPEAAMNRYNQRTMA